MGFEETAGMVSNTLRMDLEELVATLAEIGKTCRDDPEYVEMRAKIKSDWPCKP
jgi:hypothetical protein